MSALFFKVSWPANIERYRQLQRAAKARGFSLRVRNLSRTRGVPLFMFYLDRKDGEAPASFPTLADVAKILEGSS